MENPRVFHSDFSLDCHEYLWICFADLGILLQYLPFGVSRQIYEGELFSSICRQRSVKNLVEIQDVFNDLNLNPSQEIAQHRNNTLND